MMIIAIKQGAHTSAKCAQPVTVLVMSFVYISYRNCNTYVFVNQDMKVPGVSCLF